MRAHTGRHRAVLAALIAVAALLAGCTAPPADAPADAQAALNSSVATVSDTSSSGGERNPEQADGDAFNTPAQTVNDTGNAAPSDAAGASPTAVEGATGAPVTSGAAGSLTTSGSLATSGSMATSGRVTSAPADETADSAGAGNTSPASTTGGGGADTAPVTAAGTAKPLVTGPELPGGGRVMFPGRTLVALYGHPGSTSLGALGQQDLPASIERAKRYAASYASVVDGPVVPTFEIIATVATAGAGADGDYSAESSVDKLRPWVEAATEAGMYVILDLQPGRASLLQQANLYIDLLRQPNVGLALDPEWKLGPGQRPLQQIGSVGADEVNAVIDWLGRLTRGNNLPQKVLVLHQFRLSMLRDAHDIVTDNPDVAVLIHMDGQGSAAGKEATWRAVTGAGPAGVTFGWKNFLAIDKPVLNPQQTVSRTPIPVMVSFQ